MPAVSVILEMLKIHTTRHVVVRAGVDALQQLAICPENKDKLTHCVALLLVAMKGVCVPQGLLTHSPRLMRCAPFLFA